MALARQITFFGQTAVVVCDANCGKAWGIHARPRVELSDDPDDFAYLADGELGEALALGLATSAFEGIAIAVTGMAAADGGWTPERQLAEMDARIRAAARDTPRLQGVSAHHPPPPDP